VEDLLSYILRFISSKKGLLYRLTSVGRIEIVVTR